MKARKVVSLGAWCQVKEQLKTNRIDAIHSPFDWLVTPLHSIIPLWGDDGRNVMEAFIPWDGGHTVKCDHYDVLYHHAFMRIDGLIRITRSAIEQAGQKLAHKFAVMDEHCRGDDPVLFVRMGGAAAPPVAWPYLQESHPLEISQLNALILFIAMRYPRLDFRFGFVRFQETTTLVYDEAPDKRLMLYSMPWPRTEYQDQWQGDPGHWAAALDWLGAARRERLRAGGCVEASFANT